jgi:hypothetical protein
MLLLVGIFPLGVPLKALGPVAHYSGRAASARSQILQRIAKELALLYNELTTHPIFWV